MSNNLFLSSTHAVRYPYIGGLQLLPIVARSYLVPAIAGSLVSFSVSASSSYSASRLGTLLRRTYVADPSQSAAAANVAAARQASPDLLAILLDLAKPIDQRARALHGVVDRPVRSAILVVASSTADTAADVAHKCRIVWILDQLCLLRPDLTPIVGPTVYSSLADAIDRLSKVNNVAWDVAELISVLKTYLTWELQLTDDLYKLGIEPHEVVDVLSRLERIKMKNRELSSKAADKKTLADITPNQWRTQQDQFAREIAGLHTPLTSVITLRLSQVPSMILERFVDKDASLLDPKARAAALAAFKKTLIPLARKSTVSDPFDLKKHLSPIA
jgi:hypothetical protein